jgi:hypothetical protein
MLAKLKSRAGSSGSRVRRHGTEVAAELPLDVTRGPLVRRKSQPISLPLAAPQEEREAQAARPHFARCNAAAMNGASSWARKAMRQSGECTRTAR